MTTEGIRQHREAITEIPKSEQLRALHEFIYARPVKSVEVHTNLSRLQDTPLIAEYELADPDYQNKETYFERNVSECVTDLLAHCSVRHIDTSAEVFTVHGVVTSPLQIQSHTNFGGSRAAEPVVEGFVKDGDITTTLRRTDTVLQIETTFQHEHWLENQTDLYPIPRTQDDYLALLEHGMPQTNNQVDFFRELVAARETLEAMVELYNRARFDTARIADTAQSIRDFVAKLGLVQDVSIRDVKRTMKTSKIPDHEFGGLLYQIGNLRRISDKDNIAELLHFLEQRIIENDTQKWRWHRTIEAFAQTYLGMSTHAVKDYIRHESYGNGGEKITIEGEVNLVVDSGEIEIWLGSGETWSGSHGFDDPETDEYEADTPGGCSYESFIDPGNGMWEDEEVALEIKTAIESIFTGLEVKVHYTSSGSFHESFQTHDIKIDAKEAQWIGSTLGMEWDETLAKIREISRDIVRKAKQTKE